MLKKEKSLRKHVSILKIRHSTFFTRFYKIWNGTFWCFLLLDIPSIQILANRPKYVVEGTAVRLTCQWTNLSHIRLISKMELVKDGISFYKWWRLWLASYAFTASLNQAGRYQCKGTIGAASQYSSPFFLVVGSKYGYSIFNDFSIVGSCYRFYFTSKIKITKKILKCLGQYISNKNQLK